MAFLSLSFFIGNGQTSTYNLPFVQLVPLQSTFQNPAAIVESTLEFQGNHHTYLGSFSDVNTTLLSLNFKLKETRAIGGYFVNEKTSDFFSRTRLYLSYQEQIELSKQTSLTAGIRFGAVNFVMEPVGFTTGGSDWGIDFSAGLELNSSNFKAGIAAHQLPNTTLQPILFEFELRRFIDLYASYKFNLSPKISYTPELRTRLNTINDTYLISNALAYNELYGVNVNVSIYDGILFQGFVTYQNLKGNAVRLLFSFYQPTRSELKKLDAQQIEFGLNLDFGKKKKS